MQVAPPMNCCRPVERVINRQGTAFRQSARRGARRVSKALVGRHRTFSTGPTNDYHATLVGNFFAVQAARLGMTPRRGFTPSTAQRDGAGGGRARTDRAKNW